MKLLLVMFCFFSVSAFASFIEVECKGTSQSKYFSVEVEEPFPYNSVFRRAQMVVTDGDVQKIEDYTVTMQAMRGFPVVRYNGPGLRLEVDFWPDQTPRWGRNYTGTLYSSLIGGTVSNIQCRFPNIF